jgi:hypothetical protein
MRRIAPETEEQMKQQRYHESMYTVRMSERLETSRRTRRWVLSLVLLVATFALVSLSVRAQEYTPKEWGAMVAEAIAMELDAVLVACPEIGLPKEPDRCYRVGDAMLHKLGLERWVRSYSDLSWYTPWEEIELEAGTALWRVLVSDDPNLPAGAFVVSIYTFHGEYRSYGLVRFLPDEE